MKNTALEEQLYEALEVQERQAKLWFRISLAFTLIALSALVVAKLVQLLPFWYTAFGSILSFILFLTFMFFAPKPAPKREGGLNTSKASALLKVMLTELGPPKSETLANKHYLSLIGWLNTMKDTKDNTGKIVDSLDQEREVERVATEMVSSLHNKVLEYSKKRLREKAGIPFLPRPPSP